MPLVGGGGSPNVAGSNPAGTGSSINYVGNFVYGYSGVMGIDDTETTMLEFTTGSEIIVAEFNFTAIERTGDQLFGTIYVDSQKIAVSWSGLSTNNNEPSYPIKVVIPPFTRVKATGDNITAAAREFAVTMTGELY
jgi:hypothetical protein